MLHVIWFELTENGFTQIVFFLFQTHLFISVLTLMFFKLIRNKEKLSDFNLPKIQQLAIRNQLLLHVILKMASQNTFPVITIPKAVFLLHSLKSE